MVDRIVVGRPATLAYVFAGATVTSVTVRVARDDGTVLVDDEAADEDDGVWSFTLPAEAVETVDWLDVRWTGMQDSQPRVDVTRVEVAGGLYVDRAKLLAVAGLDQVSALDADDVIAEVERRIDEATWSAWTPRFHRQSSVVSDGRVWADWTPLRAVLSVDGEPAEVDFTEAGLVRLDAIGPVTLRYEHGHSQIPSDLRSAAERAAAESLLMRRNQRSLESAREFVSEGYMINFAAQPDYTRGRVFGMPDVDAVIMSHSRRSLRGA